jgi:hypothetical protein
MVEMPESYDSICRKKGILAETLYNLPELPKKESSWFEEANLVLHSTARGIFQLYYAIRSFPKPTDDRIYHVFYITKSGIFYSCNTHSHLNTPIDFTTEVCKYWDDFKFNDMITLKPNTREIVLLKNYRYTELINGNGVPNTFNWYDHPEIWNTTNKHQILVESDTYMALLLDFNKQMYEALRRGHPYMWLRKDNYIPIDEVRFNRQPY